jgi:hypothetical protein
VPQRKRIATDGAAEATRHADRNLILGGNRLGIAYSVRLIRDQSGLAMRRVGAAQAVVVMAEQLIDRAKILQHLDMMLAERIELNLIDPDLPFGVEKPLLQLLEDLQGQLLFDIRHGLSPTLFAQDAPDHSPRVIGHFFRPVCRRPSEHSITRANSLRRLAMRQRRGTTRWHNLNLQSS